MAQRGGGEALGNFSECSRVQLVRTDVGGVLMRRMKHKVLVENVLFSTLNFLALITLDSHYFRGLLIIKNVFL